MDRTCENNYDDTYRSPLQRLFPPLLEFYQFGRVASMHPLFVSKLEENPPKLRWKCLWFIWKTMEFHSSSSPTATVDACEPTNWDPQRLLTELGQGGSRFLRCLDLLLGLHVKQDANKMLVNGFFEVKTNQFQWRKFQPKICCRHNTIQQNL